MRSIFVTGGTGYIGSRLIPILVERGHAVLALTRPSSQGRLPAGCTAVLGDALDAATYADRVAPADTFVHLVGVAHPGPGKGEEFRRVDLRSIQAAVGAAKTVKHFVYLSVGQPAPIMADYIAVRQEGERLVTAMGVDATFLRPWYVVGPGHRWPIALLPAYWIAALLPWTRAGARRLGLVTLRTMLRALVFAIENPASGIRVMEVPEIRSLKSL